jgi:hypothetical protein
MLKLLVISGWFAAASILTAYLADQVDPSWAWVVGWGGGIIALLAAQMADDHA